MTSQLMELLDEEKGSDDEGSGEGSVNFEDTEFTNLEILAKNNQSVRTEQVNKTFCRQFV